MTFVVFEFLGLNYAALLALTVGLSVLIPFVGAAVVTIPVALVAIFQFGWTWDMAWILIAYAVIQALDGNFLVPLLFSEAVDLHPITIIVAVLAFGGLWGIWGVFFAIPLATLVKAIYNAWPVQGSRVRNCRRLTANRTVEIWSGRLRNRRCGAQGGMQVPLAPFSRSGARVPCGSGFMLSPN